MFYIPPQNYFANIQVYIWQPNFILYICSMKNKTTIEAFEDLEIAVNNLKNEIKKVAIRNFKKFICLFVIIETLLIYFILK